MRVIGLCLPKW